MQDNTAFLNFIIEKSNPYISSLGGQAGYQEFRKKNAEYDSEFSSLEEMVASYIQGIEDDEPEAQFFSRVLLLMYSHYEKRGASPQILKELEIPIKVQMIFCA